MGVTTDLAVYLDGTVWHTKVLPLGGRNVTNDIAIGLNVPFGVAERLKLIYGHTLPEAVAGLEPVEAPGFESSRPQQVSQEFLAEIIEARMEEILGLVARELHDLGCQGLIGSGVVLTGGVADQRGIRELATDILEMPVRKGQPHRVEGVSERLMNPTFATGLGLLVWGSRQNNHSSRHYVTRRHGPWMERAQRLSPCLLPLVSGDGWTTPHPPAPLHHVERGVCRRLFPTISSVILAKAGIQAPYLDGRGDMAATGSGRELG